MKLIREEFDQQIECLSTITQVMLVVATCLTLD